MNSDHVNGAPSLLAIRAFEAAARCSGFTAAAEELGLTQSAISRHVKSLEETFGGVLFERNGRRVSLTPAGATYFFEVSEGLRRIQTATRFMMARRRKPDAVTLSLLPSIAALWLAPRLAQFTASHPNLELNIQASRTLADLSNGEVDVCLRYGKGHWRDVEARLFSVETLTPVCAPAYAAKFGLGRNPEALLDLPLLADDLEDDWRAWLTAAGISEAPRRSGPRLNESASLYQAAAEGAGVALGRSLLVEHLLAEGRLVAPFDLKVRSSFAYWIVTPKGPEPRLGTRQLLRWLDSQKPL